jgi:hypothetical protein
MLPLNNFTALKKPLAAIEWETPAYITNEKASLARLERATHCLEGNDCEGSHFGGCAALGRGD